MIPDTVYAVIDARREKAGILPSVIAVYATEQSASAAVANDTELRWVQMPVQD